MSVPPSAGSPSKQFGDVTAPVSAAGWTAGWTLAEKSEDLARRYRCAADDAAKLSRGLAAGDLHGRMRAVVDAVWTHLHQLGVSWVGFYMPQPVAVGNFGGAEPITELVLGPSRNTPACSLADRNARRLRPKLPRYLRANRRRCPRSRTRLHSLRSSRPL